MGRTPGSKNRSKEEIAAEKAEKERRKAATSLSNVDFTDEELQRRMTVGLAEIERFQAEARSANGKARKERQRLMTYGITKDQIDFALSLRKEESGDAMDAWRKRQQVARWLGHAIGTQPDLFAENELSELDRARASGEKAGLEGKDCKPPYGAETPEGQAWIEHWHVGNKERTRIIVQTMEGGGSEKAAEEKAADAFNDAVEDEAPDEGEQEPDPEPAA